MTIRAMLQQVVGSNNTSDPIRVLGIDLGTTNSVVAEAYWPPRESAPLARCLEVEQDTDAGPQISVLVPSVVALTGNRVHIGEGAKRLRSRSGELKLRRNRNLFYECKNDMGTRQSYPDAPAGFLSPAQIGGHVLRYLLSQAGSSELGQPVKTVVTVPASFQTSQRADTLKAAALAGVSLSHRDLIDEPLAALLDYIDRYDLPLGAIVGKTLLVFDFGGGTCDVAVFSVLEDPKTPGLGVAPLSVSRYHRLGGGDIDAAIVHEVLVTQLLNQNAIAKHELDFEDRKRWLEPALLGQAEALKIMLCTELQKMHDFGIMGPEDTECAETEVQLPYAVPVRIGQRTYHLDSPKLSGHAFAQLLEPFLDRDFLFARHTDYRMTASIFGPMIDALERAGISPADVDYCLMVGGSSLIPQVVPAVDAFLARAQLLMFKDRESYKACVARGAALQALAVALTGNGLVRDICYEDILLKTESKSEILIERGTDLPFPGDGSFKSFPGLAVSVPVGTEPAVRVEVLAQDRGDSPRNLVQHVWPLNNSVSHGERLNLEYRLGADRVLELRLSLMNVPDHSLQQVVENPLTNVVNPSSTLLQIQEIEEQLRNSEVAASKIVPVLQGLAELYGSVGQNERAIAILKRAAKRVDKPDANLANSIALCANAIGDYVTADKYYAFAAETGRWPGGWFNQALSLRQRGLYAEALQTIDKALALKREPPFLILRALLLKAVGADHRAALDEGLRTSGPIESLSDWDLGWLRTGAQEAENDALLRSTEAESRKRAKRRPASATEAGPSGELPFLLAEDSRQ